MIHKCVIPVAGFGTRMLPAAKAVPKELLPILDRPAVQYVVEEAADAGCADVLLVTARDKRAVEDHFDRHAELEARLEASGKSELLASVRALAERVQIHAVRQPEARGLGHAVLMAKRHVGDAPFLCLLGDTVFTGASPARQLVEAHAQYGGVVIGVEEVPAEKVSRYGIVGGAEVAPGIVAVSEMVEKPTADNAPSRLAIAARYALVPEVFDALASTAPGKGNEVQLTDALRALIGRVPVHAVVLRGARHDIGNPADWLLANLAFAARDAQLWATVRPALDALLKKG